MAFGKLLYATDKMEPDYLQIQRLLTLRTLGIEEIIFVQNNQRVDWKSSLGDFGITTKVVSVQGPLVSSIVAAIRKEAAGMVAANFYSDRNRSFLRSQTRALFKMSPVPVVSLPVNGTKTGFVESGIFSKVIFATDWSCSSEKAMRFLFSLKNLIQTLEVVHVIDKRLSVRDMREIKKKSIQSRKEFQNHDIDAEAHIYAGKRWKEIIQAAREYSGTCIVMGATARICLTKPVFNTCSWRVAQASTLPTIVIP